MSARAAWSDRDVFRLIVLAAALSACGRERSIAKLAALSGAVEYDRPKQRIAWHSADLGESFWLGDGLRTHSGYAELGLYPAGTLRVQSNTTVRFMSSAVPNVPRQVVVENGEVEVETSTVEIDLAMRVRDVGQLEVARIRPGSLVRVTKGGSSTRFDVRVGKIDVERSSEHRTLAQGEVFDLHVGRPMIEASATAAPDAGVTSAFAESTALRFDPEPGRAELSITAGESATLHHPQPPVRVRVSYAGCPGELALESARGTLEYGEQRVRGRGGAVLRLAQGQHRYRVLCMDGGALAATAAAEGVLRVRADTGTHRLSGAAPQANVDADGRRYTVRYPNLPPALTLRWPNAPSAASYDLQLEPERGAPRTQVSTRPTVALPPGALGEGTHRFWFQAGAARSPLGQVRVEFDPTGRTASLSSPVDQSFAPGADTVVKGSVVAQASVTIEGVKIAVDGGGHFETHITAPIASDALAVRVQHPATGIHYYLRRVSHAGP